jgi:divalent metal cation (Fe/Co/Zn/Cd) transporter
MVLVSLGWGWADPIAAMIIVVLIGRAAWQVIRQTGGVLVDTAPYRSKPLAALALQVPSVERVIRARSRGTKDAAQIDIDVQVPAEMTAAQTSAIAEAIRQKFMEVLSGVAEVEVHFVPQNEDEKDYALTARARADALGLSTHEVRVSDTTDGKVLEMHVEVPPNQTLGEAHAQVTQLEDDVRSSLPELAEVVTHIEPAQPTPEESAPTNGEDEMLKKQVLELLNAHYPSMNWHHVRVLPYEGSGDIYAVSLHVMMDAELTVEEAHKLAEDAELLIRGQVEQIERVTIHTEPNIT